MVSKSLKPAQCPLYVLCGDEHPRLQPRPQPSSSLWHALALPRANARERQYRKRHTNCKKYILSSLLELQTDIKNRHNFPLTVASLHQATCPGKAGPSLPRLWSFPHHLYRACQRVSGTSAVCGYPLDPLPTQVPQQPLGLGLTTRLLG